MAMTSSSCRHHIRITDSAGSREGQDSRGRASAPPRGQIFRSILKERPRHQSWSENEKALECDSREPYAIRFETLYFFFFALVPLAFLAGFLVPHGLRVPQPFPANLLTS
jgi:hypothetical protein